VARVPCLSIHRPAVPSMSRAPAIAVATGAADAAPTQIAANPAAIAAAVSLVMLAIE